jgi:ribonuclease HII
MNQRSWKVAESESPLTSSRAPSRGPRGGVRSSSLEAESERVLRLHAAEAEAHAAGWPRVAGVDEAGRGALAGPVFAAAVVLAQARPILGLDDSKALAPEVREGLAGQIRARALFGIGSSSAAEIDASGIVAATFQAMRRALADLEERGGPADFVLVDGFPIPGLAAPQKAIVRGDSLVAAIAAASILAKTARDRVLRELDATHPAYGFASNKGYGSADHLRALLVHGPSAEHRLTFDRVLRGGRAAAAA